LNCPTIAVRPLSDGEAITCATRVARREVWPGGSLDLPAYARRPTRAVGRSRGARASPQTIEHMGGAEFSPGKSRCPVRHRLPDRAALGWPRRASRGLRRPAVHPRHAPSDPVDGGPEDVWRRAAPGHMSRHGLRGGATLMTPAAVRPEMGWRAGSESSCTPIRRTRPGRERWKAWPAFKLVPPGTSQMWRC